VPNVKKIRGLNLPGNPWAYSGLLRDDLYFYLKKFYLKQNILSYISPNNKHEVSGDFAGLQDILIFNT
jgi:hypothetical protein